MFSQTCELVLVLLNSCCISDQWDWVLFAGNSEVHFVFGCGAFASEFFRQSYTKIHVMAPRWDLELVDMPPFWEVVVKHSGVGHGILFPSLVTLLLFL